MSASPARVTLRQFCRLGLPGPLLLPSLLPVLREYIPSSHAAFFFVDERGSITNLYAERFLAPDAMANYHDRHNNEVFRQQYLQRVTREQPTSRRSVSPEERQKDYYRDVLAPLGIEHFLYAIVRHKGHAIGQLSLYRGSHESAYTREEEGALADIVHYLGEALAIPTPLNWRDLQDQSVEEGIALLDPDGQELFADANWARLIRLAQGNAIAPASALLEREALPRFVAAILGSLNATTLAVHRVDTSWGQFAFRKHKMASATAGSATAVLVSRLASEPLRLAQGAAALGLSPQQREAAVLVACGKSNQEIAELMGVSANTAGYHVKQVFAKLDVHERSAVAATLSGALSDGLNRKLK